MNYFPRRREPMLLQDTTESRNADALNGVYELHQLLHEDPLPMTKILLIIKRLNTRYKVGIITPKEAHAGVCIVLHTLETKSLYIDPWLNWKPNGKQKEIMAILDQHPVPSTPKHPKYTRELGKLRKRLWNLYLAEGSPVCRKR